MENLGELNKVTELNGLKSVLVQTRLSEEIAQNVVTKEFEKQIKVETIELLAENLSKSLEELNDTFFNESVYKTDFNKDFAKNESEYKGIFTLFNTLAKGKSNNSVNSAFYVHSLDKKYKFGKDYNGLFMLAFIDTLDLIGQVRNPQKFTTSQFKRAFKEFNTNCTSFKAFDKAMNRANEINELIASYKEGAISAKEFFEGLKSVNGRGFNEKEALKIASYIYSEQAKAEARAEAEAKKK